ncbi:MAG: hypothetical protein H6905_00480 [Hyphomicrobiales bacterium]|nr:hypothetical protein [Hyphomicrobiales bacterium]
MTASLLRRQALAMAVLIMTLGCSSDPDRSEDSLSWTESRVQHWKNEPYPSLGDTPARPATSSPEERREILDELEQDRSAGSINTPEQVE